MKTLQQFVKFILYACIIAAVVVVFVKSGIMDTLDRHILLEEKHPGYYALTNSMTSKAVPADVASTGFVNQIVNSCSTTEYDQGFTITVNADGSVTYVGTNNSENTVYVSLTNSAWTLRADSYVLSDSLDGIPVSTADFKLCAMARIYHVGGQTDYVMIADMTDLTTTFFTTDFSKYNDYYVQLVIAPGYTSPGTTIYPMLTTYDQRTTTYQPCLQSGADAYDEDSTDITHYVYVKASKADFIDLMNAGDLPLLQHFVQYQAGTYGSWTVIDFGDGTGIQFPENDSTRLQYGELVTGGQIGLLYGDQDSVVLADLPLNETTEFNTYLQMLNNPDYTILLAIRDDGVNALTDYMMSELESLGARTPLTERVENSWSKTYYRSSYYAVLNPGQASVEAASDEALDYSGTTRDGRHSFTIRSCGWNTGESQALIQVDGTEYSMNRRGMNIVVYDNTSGTVVDHVTFDTCSGLTATRELSAAE